MKQNTLFVVGDKFNQFATNPQIVTVSQLCGLMTISGMMMFGNEVFEIHPGQGLSDDDILSLLHLKEKSPFSERFDLRPLEKLGCRAPANQSHKRMARNTMISSPRQIADSEYLLDLMIDENCELMGDHQTGQHLQGMLLLEAARQSFLAVTEAFYLPQDGTRFYFVIHGMEARYSQFAFPLPAIIRYRLRSHEAANPLRQHFVADITVEQAGGVAASFVTDFTTFEDARISSKEGKLAAAAVARSQDEILGRFPMVA